jgi:ferredoxin
MQVLDRGGHAVACGSCLSQVLDRGAHAVAQTNAFGDAMLPQQEKSIRQMSRRTR